MEATNPIRGLGIFLSREEAPKVKNLERSERDKVLKLLAKYDDIITNAAASPISENEASLILNKLTQLDQPIRKKSKVRSALKKTMGSTRLTIGAVQAKIAQFREEKHEWNARTYINTLGQASGIKDPIADDQDYDQRCHLDQALSHGRAIASKDFTENTDDWIHVLRELGGLKTLPGGEAEGRVKQLAAYVLFNLALAGALDARFEQGWSEGDFGTLTKHEESFHVAMMVSHALNARYDEAEKHLEAQDEDGRGKKPVSNFVDLLKHSNDAAREQLRTATAVITRGTLW